MTDRYGKFILKLGDEDARRRWGGQVRPVAEQRAKAPVGQLVTLGAQLPVLTLKKDLDVLGFKYFDRADGTFDIYTELALREFQVYARFETIAEQRPAAKARHYCERLAATKNLKAYKGPASGVLNNETADLLALWIEKNWRCPVTMARIQGGRITADEGFWRFDQVTGPGRRSMSKSTVVAARDISGYYHVPADRETREKEWKKQEDGFRRIGRYYLHKKEEHRAFGGCEPTKKLDCWHDVTAVTPELCYGKSLKDMDEHTVQSFLVLWTVAQQECEGYLDVINTWDRAVVSFGLCHFIYFGLKKRPSSDGGLHLSTFATGTAAEFLAGLPKPIFDAYFGKFGIKLEGSGGGAWFALEGEDGQSVPLKLSTTLSKSGWFAAHNEKKSKRKKKGKKKVEEPAQEASTAELSESEKVELDLLEHRINFLKSWHWDYRYQMAHRSTADLRKASVRACFKQYVSKMLQHPWPGKTKVAQISGKPATLAQVMPTPFLLGFLAMRYVNFPKDVVSGGSGDNLPDFVLRRAIDLHKVGNKGKKDPRWEEDPTKWPKEFHEAMALALDDLQLSGFGAKSKDRIRKSFATYKKRHFPGLEPPVPAAAAVHGKAKVRPTPAASQHPLSRTLRLKFVEP